jgi:hypothetical protein
MDSLFFLLSLADTSWPKLVIAGNPLEYLVDFSVLIPAVY